MAWKYYSIIMCDNLQQTTVARTLQCCCYFTFQVFADIQQRFRLLTAAPQIEQKRFHHRKLVLRFLWAFFWRVFRNFNGFIDYFSCHKSLKQNVSRICDCDHPVDFVTQAVGMTILLIIAVYKTVHRMVSRKENRNVAITIMDVYA